MACSLRVLVARGLAAEELLELWLFAAVSAAEEEEVLGAGRHPLSHNERIYRQATGYTHSLSLQLLARSPAS